MFGLGHFELAIILVVFLLFFGGKRIPALAKGLGRGLRSFQHALQAPASADDATTPDDGGA